MKPIEITEQLINNSDLLDKIKEEAFYKTLTPTGWKVLIDGEWLGYQDTQGPSLHSSEKTARESIRKKLHANFHCQLFYFNNIPEVHEYMKNMDFNTFYKTRQKLFNRWFKYLHSTGRITYEEVV